MSANLLFLEEIDHLILSSDKLFLTVKFNRLEITCKSCSSIALHYRLILGFFIATITFFFSDLDSMPTFLGKKLLVSNLWGILRHPNYTGDIMIHVALALPGVFTRNIVAAAPALITIFMFIHRAWRDHNRCRRRYGSAWQRYCKRVPSVIIPKIL